MTHQNTLQDGIVSKKCFRLLRFKHEFQGDAKVLKAVVDEVDVLRLCRSLGMTVSTEATSKAKHNFEFGLFNPSDYDVDFARFLRDKLQKQDNQVVEEQLSISCLFGKQWEVKTELARMGFWRTECDEGLSSENQGVYCIEKGEVNHRQFVVFAWLDASLFEPQAIRDTPAYVLRFLISLSSSVTCCLSQEDFRRIKNEVDAVSDSPNVRWNSCSVAFRVQKQVAQSDSISCGAITRTSIPEPNNVKSVLFVNGSFPAIAVEIAAPSTTEWVHHNDVVPYTDFADWLLKKDEKGAIELPQRKFCSMDVRGDLLEKFGQYPDEELLKLRSIIDEQIKEAKQNIGREAFEYAQSLFGDATKDVDMLFAVRCPMNMSRMDLAFTKYRTFLQNLPKNGVPINGNYEVNKMLYLPDRIQSQMKVLDNTLQHYPMTFEGVLGAIVRDEPFNTDNGHGRWLWRVMGDVVQKTTGWLWSSNPDFSEGFRFVMENHHQPTLQVMWMNAVYKVVSWIENAACEQRVQQYVSDRERQFELEVEAAMSSAFKRLCEHLKKSQEGQLRIKIDKVILSSEGVCFNIGWDEEVEKEPSKVVRMYQLSPTSVEVSSLGIAEFEPGFHLRQLATVKINVAIAILVQGDKTTVRRVQFPLQSTRKAQKAEQKEVRLFPRECSLCSIRASDRQVAFLFDVREGRLGTVAFCRFNEAFTRVEATHQIELDISFGLAKPLVNILLTERSLCAVDVNGDMQSYDVRTRRTSKKVLSGCRENESNGNSKWVGGLMSFADELVVGRASIDGHNKLKITTVSNEDHRALPIAGLETGLLSEKLTVGSMGDMLYVVDAGNGTVYASELNVTVRSDAYRIQRSGNGAKSTRQGLLQAGRNANGDDGKHWLRVFFHVFEKFPVRSLIDVSLNPGALFSLDVGVAVIANSTSMDGCGDIGDIATVCTEYFNNLMLDLRRLNKPLSNLNLARKVRCRWSEQTESNEDLQVRLLRDILMAIVSLVPVQICRAEDNMLKLLQDGEVNVNASTSADVAKPSVETDQTGTDASEIAQTIRFGLLSPLLEAWNGRCVVVTSMGKQSTGKSYFLNHLAGTSFAISGSRCTDGAWMSLRFVSADVLLVVLDFEGLGSFERSEQEDIFLSVLNASVSLFTVFRMESRFDKDIDGLFSRFQKGVQLIKNDPRLFRGLLYMNVKDVNMNDRQGVVDELVSKLDVIFEANKDQNFLTEVYDGQLEINCSPPFGTVDYYQCMENDAARTLSEIVASSTSPAPGFVTGKAFLDCIRIVLAKISILDWTSMDKSTKNLVIADVKQKLPGILRTGCQVPSALVADPTIPKHLLEDVLKVGTSKKLVVVLKEMCEANPGYSAKWLLLNDVVALDSFEDEEVDLGFDVTCLVDKRLDMVQKTIGILFKCLLALKGKEYETSRLTTEDQSDFDSFAAFVLRRRKMKVARWLRSTLSDQLSEIRTQLEQHYVDSFVVYFSRCQHQCTKCRLGCMHSVMHAPEFQHDCSTDHKCRGQCEYAECQSGLNSPCSRSAGHEGKCECAKGDHTCGQTCVLAQAANCDKTCSKRAEHLGEHRCSVQVHVCGEKCSAMTCNATCLLDIQREHTTHKCAEVQCLHPCTMDGCTSTCGEMDHFHGQIIESRTFAEESGLVNGANDEIGDENVTHMCTGSHGCTEMCTVDGICEQKVHLKKSARTYAGARGTFEYIYQEMNGTKKQCAHVLVSGEQDHEGFGHSCIVQSSDGQNTVHYCDARCPSCSYYCNKHFGHMGLHATSHGNMRHTYFMTKGENDIDIEERKYQVGERGIAEMCNLFCSKMGRGHVHYLSCESKDNEKCVYTGGDASKDQRRHCVDELFPPPGKDMDELLHAKFWSSIGWEDPCSEEERTLFAKCRFKCNAPEHEEEGKTPSYCVHDAWHKPEVKPEGDDGFAYIDGHKFECMHAVDSGKFHSIFVLDSSGSMSGQPWTNLLCACDEFTDNRLRDGGENDSVSYVTFDNHSHIRYEAKPLTQASHMTIPYSGGGTCFEEGLRAANEVLSRNNFEEYKAVLIFFSDGQPWDVELGIALAKHIRSTYAKYDLKAFVAGFGRVNLSVLERMAVEMGGEYRQVLDIKELRTEFQRIAAVLCNSEASLAFLDANDENSAA